MSDEKQPQPEFWTELRGHPAFQIAIVFAGGSWLALQAADIFGLATDTVRVIGGVLITIFVLLFGYALVAVLRGDRTKAAVARVRTRTMVAATAALLLLGTGAWFARPYVTPPLRPGSEVIAVLPFNATGPGIQLLGEGLVDLLSTNLNEVGVIRTINPRTTLHQYNDVASDGSIDLDGQLRVGRNAGAGSVLVGSVVSTGTEVRINAQLLSVENGSVIARAQENGRPDSVLALVDQLSVQLLQDIWRSRAPLPELRIGAITTHSMPALRAYLRGERFYRSVAWDSASAAFQEAVAYDSTFALAHFRLGETYGWRENFGSTDAREHSDKAARYAERLPARERALIVAHQLHEQGDVTAIDSLQSYVRRFPDDVAGHYLLADARFHAASVVGLDAATMIADFERVHAMDSTFAPNYAHLIDLVALVGDSASYNRYVAHYHALAPGEATLYAALRDIRWSDRGVALAITGATLRSDAARRPGSIVRVINVAAAHASEQRDIEFFFDAIDTLLAVNETNVPLRLQANAIRVTVLAAAGRFREADREAEQVRAQNIQVTLSNLMLFIFTGIAPADRFIPERKQLEANANQPVGVYLLALQALIRNDIAAAERHVEVLRRDSISTTPIQPGMLDAIDGWIVAARGDTIGGIRQMKTALLELGYAPEAVNMTGVQRAQLAMLQSTQPDTRAEGIRRLEHMLLQEPVSTLFFGVTLAQAYLAEGRTEDAAALYSRMIDMWHAADPEIQPRVRALRDALARITGENTGE